MSKKYKVQNNVIYVAEDDTLLTLADKIKQSPAKTIQIVPKENTQFIDTALDMKSLHNAAIDTDHEIILVSNNEQIKNLASAEGIRTEEFIDPENDKDQKIVDYGENDPDIAKANQKAKKSRIFKREHRIYFIITGIVLLTVAFLIWAFAIAPHEKITIMAKMTQIRLDDNVELSFDQPTDYSKKILHVEKLTIDDTETQTVNPSETRDEGAKATGKIHLCSDNALDFGNPVPVNITIKGKVFYTLDQPTLSNPDTCQSGLAGRSVDVNLIASATGTNYNIGKVEGEFVYGKHVMLSTDSIANGVTHVVRVANQADFNAAVAKMTGKSNDDVQAEIYKKLNGDYTLITTSVSKTSDRPTISLPLGDSIEKDMTVTASMTSHYSMVAVRFDEVAKYAKEKFDTLAEADGHQIVYNYGINAGEGFNGYTSNNGVDPHMDVHLLAEIGPKIDIDKEIINPAFTNDADSIKKRLYAIQNVENVEVEFWPFWAQIVPFNRDNVDVQFVKYLYDKIGDIYER